MSLKGQTLDSRLLYFTEEDEESGKDWSDLEREAAEEDKKERIYDRTEPHDFDRKRKGARAGGRFDEDDGKKSKHDKGGSNHKSSSHHKSSSSNHKSSNHKSPSKHSNSR